MYWIIIFLLLLLGLSHFYLNRQKFFKRFRKKEKKIENTFWYRLKKNKLALAGGVIVITMFLISIFAPLLAPYNPNHIDIENILASPNWAHPLGTDELGRDVLSRMIWGSRISLKVGFVAVGISAFIGIVIGSLAGFYGKWVDQILMRFVDIMLCFPAFFLILAVITFLEPSIWNIMIVIGITSWMNIARMVRAEFLSLKERDFVVAARSLGLGDLRIIFIHIFPNAMAPVLVSAVLGIAGAILTESALSFLGIGVQPPIPSWGNILTAGKNSMEIAWWLSVYPGLAILITVLGYNLLGEGVRDASDPKIDQ